MTCIVISVTIMLVQRAREIRDHDIMAINTPSSYRNLVLYEVFIRNHGVNGTFSDIEKDLPRLHTLGVDVLWFMPIHPIGEINRKGSKGSPYSIRDYRAVNPDYGTKDDFARLIAQAHERGMKIMIDVVYHHTAHDSVLVKEHPEFFRQDEAGHLKTTVPDWSDVVDLDHPNPELTKYLIEALKEWVRLGVDGFRCDVASLVPLKFWQQARAEVNQVNPDVIWLAESVHASFVGARREQGLTGLSDSELYEVFDLTYDYDIWPIWQLAVQGKLPVRRYIEMLRYQECIYPKNFIKMRCVENHDQARIMRLAPSRTQAIAWMAFEAFNKGPFLIYCGQESACKHTPSLFEVDKIDWADYSLQPFLTRLAKLKKDPAQVEGKFVVVQADPAIQAAWEYPGKSLYGIFNTSGKVGYIMVNLPDGTYRELLSDDQVTVRGGKMLLPETAAIVRFNGSLLLRPAYSELLDYSFTGR
jgi:Alpha amylase, catalytic domain/Bacterial Alpha amylase C-terminal domain